MAEQNVAPKRQVTPYQLFMLVLSVWALVALAAQTSSRLSPEAVEILKVADTALCLVFLLDFANSFYQASDRWRYFRTWGWIDLLSSIPAVDALRIGRVARLVRVLRVLRAVRSTRAIVRYVVERRKQSVALAAALLTLVMLTFASIAILQFEVPAGGNIQTAPDAMWWSISTMSTLGYGDVYPVTSEGRVIALLLMCAGVSVFGTVAGLIATWFVSEDLEEEQSELREILESCRRLEQRLEAIAGARAAQ